MKFILYLSICLSLVVYWFASIGNPKLEKLGSGYMNIFSTCVVSHPYIINRTSLGFAHSYRIRSEHAETIRPLFRNIDGESITLHNADKRTILHQLSNHQKISTSRIGTLQVTSLYSNRTSSFVRDGNNRINLQVSYRNGTVTIGWPVILGSF